MTTTIQVNEDTLEILKRYKHQLKLQTYDEVIKKFMTLNMAEYSKKYKGFLGKKDMAYVMKDLRDKTDRY